MTLIFSNSLQHFFALTLLIMRLRKYSLKDMVMAWNPAQAVKNCTALGDIVIIL